MGLTILKIVLTIIFVAVMAGVVACLLVMWLCLSLMMAAASIEGGYNSRMCTWPIGGAILILLIVIGTPLFWFGIVFGPSGKISQVETSYISSSYHSEDDIKIAMSHVKSTFKSDFGGCNLTQLWYDEDCMESEAYWQAQYGAEDVIVLQSNFDTGRFPEEDSLESKTSYTDWQWIVVKQDDKWSVVDWGY